MYRFYPMRFTRSYWNIPLLTRHKCSDLLCARKFNFDIENEMIGFIDNPYYIDGKCELADALLSTSVHIDDYDYMNQEKIYNIDEIVIPDREFSIHIDFPLTNEYTVSISTPEDITMRYLLLVIQVIYRQIYQEEEETSSMQTFHISIECECKDKHCLYQHTLKECEKIVDCSICYETMKDKQVYNLECQHLFHKECIEHWTKEHSQCPLCRAYLKNCNDCQGRGIIETTQQFKVLPAEYRRNEPRNTTDGLYGIYHYDLESLVLNSLVYNRVLKTLYLSVNPYIILE